jgi:hypothetical protein
MTVSTHFETIQVVTATAWIQAKRNFRTLTGDAPHGIIAS